LNPSTGEITNFTAEDAAGQSDSDLIMSVIEDGRLKDGIVMAEDRLAERAAQRTASHEAETETTSASETGRAEKSLGYSVGQTVYLDDNRPPYRIERIGPRMELRGILPDGLFHF
jgi:hypothetical protein